MLWKGTVVNTEERRARQRRYEANRKPSTTPCAIDGCNRMARTKGWCNAHYLRFQRLGSPLAPRRDGRFQTAEQRFWGKVDRRNADECWMWQGLPKSNGYGYLTIDGSHEPAHRLSWAIHNGRPVPEGLLVLHSCDTPMCVNPHHLRVGDHVENMRDKAIRKRQAGERNPYHKLTNEDVIEIRDEKRRGVPTADLAQRFGVSRSNINFVAAGKSWKHLLADEGGDRT